MHAYVRKWIAEHVGADVADKLRILYGGSGAPPALDVARVRPRHARADR